jgi:hypothetical protein
VANLVPDASFVDEPDSRVYVKVELVAQKFHSGYTTCPHVYLHVVFTDLNAILRVKIKGRVGANLFVIQFLEHVLY